MTRPPFSRRSTTVFRAFLGGGAVLLVTGGFAYYHYYRDWYWRPVQLAPDQPVLFSHRHHTDELRIDCRYCHTSVETSSFAGLPATHTCLTCHSQIFRDTSMLAPVIESARRNRPLAWNRVNDVPEHVYFNHGIHIAKGVACTTCHGDVGSMALMQPGEPFEMRWCIDCHRDPAPRLEAQPADVFAPHPSPTTGRALPDDTAERLLNARFIEVEHLDDCSVCHH